MLVVHAAYVDRQFFLWGERPLSPGTKKRPAHYLPFDAGRTALPALASKRGTLMELAVWIPSTDGQPYPSTGLIAESPVSDARPRWNPGASPACG